MLFDRLMGPVLIEKVESGGSHSYQYRFTTVSLNVDDFREIEAIVDALGLPVKRQVGPWDGSGESALEARETSADIGKANPVLVGYASIDAFRPEPAPGARLLITLTPLDLEVWAQDESGDLGDDLRRSVLAIARVMEGGRRRIPPRQVAQILTALISLAFIAIWVWVMAASQSLPTAVVGLGVLLLAMRGHATRLVAVERWWQRRGPATWLDPKSRAELATERANTRRDWRVGLLTGVGGAALGSILGAILQARLSR